VTASAKEFLLGCLACAPAAAADGEAATAWQTPFVGVRGQWLQYEVPAPVTFDHLDLEVIADGRHSVPTKVTLEVDGEQRTLTVPAIADRGPETATAKGRLEFPEVQGRKFRLTIDDVRENRAVMFATASTRLEPVGIAELGVPGLRMPRQPARIPGGCRNDLATIDGQPLPLQVEGTTDAAGAVNGLQVAVCGNRSFSLGPGKHTLSTARGKDAGFSIDRLVLASQDAFRADGTGRIVETAAAAPAAPKLTVTDNGRTKVRAHVTGATDGFWLVLGESRSPGWRARIDGRDLGSSQLVDGYANGWFVERPPSGEFDVVFEWTPQRQVWLSIWISLVTALACLALIALTWRTRIRAGATVAAGDADARLSFAPSVGALTTRARWGTTIGAGLLAALLVGPVVGVVTALLTALLVWRPRMRAIVMLVPGALLALCGAYILFGQIRYRYPSVFEWPTVFPRARTIAWIAVMLLAADALVELVRRRRQPRTPGDPGADKT
jgi:hypothetical protein